MMVGVEATVQRLDARVTANAVLPTRNGSG